MKIDAIKDGIVIDHITAGRGMTLYNYLGLDALDCTVALIKNVSSSKMGKKDIIKIEVIDGTFDFDDVLASHFVRDGILDDGNGAVEFVELKVMINGHGLSGLDMVQNISFSKSTYIQHGSSTSSNVRIRAIRTYTPYCA